MADRTSGCLLVFLSSCEKVLSARKKYRQTIIELFHKTLWLPCWRPKPAILWELHFVQYIYICLVAGYVRLKSFYWVLQRISTVFALCNFSLFFVLLLLLLLLLLLFSLPIFFYFV